MYYLQIKSSPNSMNVDTIHHLNRKVKELQEHRENYVNTYGAGTASINSLIADWF